MQLRSGKKKSGGSNTAGAQPSGSQLTATSSSYNLDLLKTWDTKFLDPANTSFAKQVSKESAFDGKERYNLKAKALKSYQLKLVAKKEHCSLNCILNIFDSTGTRQDLLTKHTLLSKANIITSKNEAWNTFMLGLDDDGKCKIHNRQIKSNMLGEFLLDSLTDSALRKLNNSKSQ